MTAFQLYAATSLYYYQGVTFFAAHFMIGFAGGYSLGSLARTGMREMGLDD
jgi:hypothetical protein